MVKNESFVIIQGWMINELGLKGNDLIVYAIIYGFSQDGESVYKGGQDYLAGWARCTTRGIRKNLTSLLEKKLILVKNVAYVNGHKVCDYAVNMDFVPNQQEQSSKTKETPQEQSSKTTGTKFLP